MSGWGTSGWGGTTAWGLEATNPLPPLPDTVGPCVLSVTNTQENVLLVRFNEAMAQDGNLDQAANYTIEPQGGAAEIVITDVMASASQPDAVQLRFTGGEVGGTYILTVDAVFDANLNPIDQSCNSVTFILTLVAPPQPRIRIFDTVFGPLGLTQRLVTRRTVETLTVNRAIDLAMHEQLSQRLQSVTAGIPLRSGKDGGRRR